LYPFWHRSLYASSMIFSMFKEVRDELEGRGAEESDLDKVSRGQMGYLVVLVIATAAISTAVYWAFPFVRNLLSGELTGYPYPHLIIGVVGTFLIAGATILYLRRGGEVVVQGIAPTPQGSSD